MRVEGASEAPGSEKPEMSNIDYARMSRVYPKQKGALTRAIKTGDPAKIEAVCAAAVAEWDEIGGWPDEWSRWQRAFDDSRPWFAESIDLRDLRT